MSDVVDRLMVGMDYSLWTQGRSGSVSSPEFAVAWRLVPYRLSGVVQDRVLVLDGIEFDVNLRHRDYGTEFLERVVKIGELGGRCYDYVAMKDCNSHSLALGRKCGFTIDDPHFLRVAWRQARQLLLPL
ncbi:hypothetical protein NKI86_31495 [Mesorhizobium sp. M0320]|uniref:hypothetical protein n=1 Tax=Mesorhizobium sp. M0320 TaxID=2956936 RepID=UPI003336F6CD